MLAGCSCPVVCTAGWPSVDAQRLLDVARAQEIELHYAGDYDPVGLAIANYMAVRYEAAIMMTKGNYLEANLQRAHKWRDENAIPSTPWDPELTIAIHAARRVVYQEDPAIWRRLLGVSSNLLQQDGR